MTATTTDRIREMLELVAVHLVDDSSAIRVEATQQTDHLLLDVHCAADDVGKLIGKSGHTISAMRLIMSAMGQKHGVRVVVEIREPDVD